MTLLRKLSSGKWLMLLAAMLMVLSLASCSSDEPKLKPVTGRTVLVYMVARNSLGSSNFDSKDLREMQTAAANGLLGNNRLIVYHSAYGSEPQLKEVKATGIEVLKTYPSDMVAVKPESMSEVIADVKLLAPAQNYGIVLWSHADGWIQHGSSASNSGNEKNAVAYHPKAFGVDLGKYMNVPDLATALNGKGFDFVYFDCCFMSGVEVAYELRNVAPRIVASVSELPADGMPYDETLRYLMADDADLVGAARTTFNSYAALSGWEQTCTMSVIRTDGLSALASAVRELYSHKPQLPGNYSVQAFVSKKSQFYTGGGEQFFDLSHYAHALVQDVDKWGNSAIEAEKSYNAVLEAINNCVEYHAATDYLWKGNYDEVKIDWHCGLSTFILTDEDMTAQKGYNELQWYRDVAAVLF